MILFQMECELERFHKQNASLDMTIIEMKQKQKSAEQELQASRQATRNVEAVVRRFKTDLYNVAGRIQDPKCLKEGVVVLYKKHIQEDVVIYFFVDYVIAVPASYIQSKHYLIEPKFLFLLTFPILVLLSVIVFHLQVKQNKTWKMIIALR